MSIISKIQVKSLTKWRRPQAGRLGYDQSKEEVIATLTTTLKKPLEPESFVPPLSASDFNTCAERGDHSLIER